MKYLIALLIPLIFIGCSYNEKEYHVNQANIIRDNIKRDITYRSMPTILNGGSDIKELENGWYLINLRLPTNNDDKFIQTNVLYNYNSGQLASICNNNLIYDKFEELSNQIKEINNSKKDN